MANNLKFDLEERTSVFSEEVISFLKTVKANYLTMPIITQLVRSATSIGANYCEANNAESKKDFVHKIGICKKEARETKYWFRILIKAVPECKEKAEYLSSEVQELVLIFSKIINSSRKISN